MKGLIKRTIAAGCCAASLGGLSGCHALQEVVDPCYPERYEFVSRRNVVGALAPQVQNGYVLDQTLWNFYFEPGTDRLTASGLDHLAYLARRRPQPDPILYLQTAQDVAYDPANPDKLVQNRRELDDKRTKAVKGFLSAQTAGRPVEFQVVVHDPAEISLSGVAVQSSIQQMQTTRFRGGLPGGTGGASGGSGSGGAGGSSGGSTGR